MTLNKQIDGTHYKNMKMQPIELLHDIALYSNYEYATAFKHLVRAPFKGEYATDIAKAKHYFALAQFVGIAARLEPEIVAQKLEKFCYKNQLTSIHRQQLNYAFTMMLARELIRDLPHADPVQKENMRPVYVIERKDRSEQVIAVSLDLWNDIFTPAPLVFYDAKTARLTLEQTYLNARSFQFADYVVGGWECTLAYNIA